VDNELNCTSLNVFGSALMDQDLTVAGALNSQSNFFANYAEVTGAFVSTHSSTFLGPVDFEGDFLINSTNITIHGALQLEKLIITQSFDSYGSVFMNNTVEFLGAFSSNNTKLGPGESNQLRQEFLLCDFFF